MDFCNLVGMPDAELSRTKLIEAHVGLAAAIARRFAGRGESVEDLTQVGCLALIHAVDRFDPTREVPLGAYAAATIRGEIQRHVRDSAAPVRVPRQLRPGAVTTAPLPLDVADPRDGITCAEARTDLRTALRQLDERERRAFGLRYVADLPRAQVAAGLGLSEVQTSRVLSRALARLAEALAEGESQRGREALADAPARA